MDLLREMDHSVHVGEHLICLIFAYGSRLFERCGYTISDEFEVGEILFLGGDELPKAKVPIF